MSESSSGEPSKRQNKRDKAAQRAQRAQELVKQQKAAERRRNLITVGIVVVVLAILVGGGVWFSMNEKEKQSDALNAAPDAGSSDYGVSIGPDDAENDIVIYEDFLCPGCGQLEEATGDELAKLADEGKVRVEYRPFDLLSRISDYSARSTSAFGVVREESGPAVAKKFHDILYDNQPSEQGPFPNADQLVDWAVEAGADEAAVRPGIEEGATDFAVKATEEAQQAGVQGTPTVLLNGEMFNGTPEDLLAAVK